MLDTAGEVKTNISDILHMDEQRQDDQVELIYNNVCEDTGCSLENLPEQCAIETGGVRWSGGSVLAA